MKEPNHPEEKRRSRVKNPAATIKSENGIDKPDKVEKAEKPEKSKNSQARSRKQAPSDLVADLTAVLSQKVVGQPAATRVIVPYIQMFQAGLAPEGRPVGVFLLLGPTGTGKTKTVEALAEVLHGSEKNVLKVDCGEFQMEHEVAKLIGAPPGYLGHRETQPMLTQQKLNAVTSEKCSLSLVLFDEIEKAAPSMTRLLLGVLDKGILRLGDNSVGQFRKEPGLPHQQPGRARDDARNQPRFRLPVGAGRPSATTSPSKLQSIALVAVRKRFSPEFVNRIDCIITYQPLTAESLSAILDHQIADLQNHVNTRLGNRSFTLEVPFEARAVPAAQGHQLGIRRARAEPHHPPLPDAAAGHAGGHQPGEPRRARAGGSRRRRRETEHPHRRRAGRRTASARQSHRAAGGRQPRPAALPGAPDGRCRLDAAHRRIRHRSQAPGRSAQAQRRPARLHAARRQRRRIWAWNSCRRCRACWSS